LFSTFPTVIYKQCEQYDHINNDHAAATLRNIGATGERNATNAGAFRTERPPA